MRAALLSGAGWSQLWPSIAALLIFAAILIPLSFLVFCLGAAPHEDYRHADAYLATHSLETVRTRGAALLRRIPDKQRPYLAFSAPLSRRLVARLAVQ